MKTIFIALAVLLISLPALAAEEGGSGEHGGEGEHKPPPKPFTGSPVKAVLELPVVKQWKKAEEAKDERLAGWAEDLNAADGHSCWQVAVGEQRRDGQHPWRRFCVPQDGSDILVQSLLPDKATGEVTYTPYPKWVTDCKPTGTFQGKC